MDFEFDMKYIKEVPTATQLAFYSLDNHDVFFGGAAAGGKLVSIFEPILTTNGWRTIETLRVGDSVFSETGEPITVLAKSAVESERTFDIEFDG